MITKKIVLLSIIIISTNFAWSISQGLNGILTFDEYQNFGKYRTGVTSFELIDGKETNAYKVVTGSYPYANSNGDIVYKQGCGLSVVNPEGFSHSIVNCPPKQKFHQLKYGHSQLSPDGLFVAVTRSYYGSEDFVVFVFDVKGNQIAKYKNMFSPTWLPNGRLLLSSSGNRYGLFVSDNQFKNISQIDNKQLQEYAYHPDVSPSGKRVVFEYNQQIWIMNMDGTGLERLLRGSKRLSYPTWSPDGKHIAYLRQDSRNYYDEAIYFFEVDGEHQQLEISTRKIFERGETGYPDIAGPLSWISKERHSKKIEDDTKMPDIKKVGYSKKSFSDLMELLEFSLGRELSQQAKVAWVKSDYRYSRRNFQNRQKKMKNILEKFSSMNQEIQKIKGTKYTKLVQKYMQEYFVMTYAKAPVETSNGMVSKLFKEEHRFPIKIQEKKYAVIPVEFNKNSVLKNRIGIESVNLNKLQKSQWVKALYTEHERKKLHSIQKIKTLFTLTPNTKVKGLIESWSENQKTVTYYGQGETPLSLWKNYETKDKNHYQLKSGLNIRVKPWGYILYDEVTNSSSFDTKAPMYLLDTSNILLGFQYLYNSSMVFNIGFDFNAQSPSDFQRELMSHIKRMRFELDGENNPKINFDLWFDNEEYASTFMTLLKLKKIELKANYSYKSIDEWLLEELEFKQEGKHVYLKQTFTSKLTKAFIRRVTDEIKRYEK